MDSDISPLSANHLVTEDFVDNSYFHIIMYISFGTTVRHVDDTGVHIFKCPD